MEGENNMAKSRVEKNKSLYETLDEEMRNAKENSYANKWFGFCWIDG